MNDTLSDLFSWLLAVSNHYGSGSIVQDALVIIVVIQTVLLLILVRRSPERAQAAASGAFDRNQALGGKIERLERSLNEVRTEVMRSVELMRSEVAGVGRPDALLAADLTPQLPPAAPVIAAAADLDRQKVDQQRPANREPPPAPLPLADRLVKTRRGIFDKIKGLFGAKDRLDTEMCAELEALLIASDLGAKTATTLLGELRADLAKGGEVGEAALGGILKMKILNILEKDAPLNPVIRPIRREDGPTVVMVVGVNGVGKTTTVAKLAASWQRSGATVMMVAADTFRAAAVEQLSEWGRRIGVPVVTGGADAKPATVVFDGMLKAKEQGIDILVIDTAGRLHTKSNLMQELEGVRSIIQRHQASAPHEVILVVDGSTGQNAISQAREFHDAVALTGLIVTKLDGTPKGGVVVAIKGEIGVPVRYIGIGEAKDDLIPFVARDFVEALFEPVSAEAAAADDASAHGEIRRKRRMTQGYD